MTPPRLHFLCDFRKKTDATGKVYFIGELGNRHLFLNTEGENLKLYMGGQIEVDLGWKKHRSGSIQANDRQRP